MLDLDVLAAVMHRHATGEPTIAVDQARAVRAEPVDETPTGAFRRVPSEPLELAAHHLDFEVDEAVDILDPGGDEGERRMAGGFGPNRFGCHGSSFVQLFGLAAGNPHRTMRDALVIAFPGDSMLLIEKILAAFANLIAVDLMKLDSEDVARARREYLGEKDVVNGPISGPDDRQVVVRFGR